MNDVRIWIGQFDTFNQTGLLLEGSMYKTVLYGVVFESFAPQPLDGALIYGVVIDPFAFQPPILDGGVNFLGCWTARIFNPGNVWIYGVGGIFKFENVAIPIATGTYGETQIIQIHPASITSFNPKISVGGSFQNNETVTVRLRLEFIDNVVSDSLEKTFNTTSSIWLSNDDFLQLYTSPNVLYCILVDAKANSQTDATVTIDLYGASS
jgi:hypothetical protein